MPLPYAVLFDQALDHGYRHDSDFAATLARWRAEAPEQYTDCDLLAGYAWVVVGCGLTYAATDRIYSRLEPVLLGFDPPAVARQEATLRPAAAAVLAARRKLDAIFGLANDLAREPGRMAALARRPWREVQGWMLTLPLIGPNNVFHLARHLGWDVAVRTGPVARLAAKLDQDSQALCAAVAADVKETVRVVDLVLWQWLVGASQEQLHDAAELARLVG